MKLKWTIEIGVDKRWVEDGFDITKDNIIDKLQTLLPYAYSNELSGKILKSPTRREIRTMQGYKTLNGKN